MREKYRLKTDTKAFLYPDQWIKFYNSLNEKQQPYFKIAINTGGRINEIRKLEVRHINFEKHQLTFYNTKIRAKRKEKRPNPRTIPINSECSQWLQRWGRKFKLTKTSTFNIPSTVAINKVIKNKLKEIGIENYKDFSSHNIRKTHGNWLKTLGVKGEEITTRLGHDHNTLIKSYVSPDLFNEKDRILIRQELGDLYADLLKKQ